MNPFTRPLFYVVCVLAAGVAFALGYWLRHPLVVPFSFVWGGFVGWAGEKLDRRLQRRSK